MDVLKAWRTNPQWRDDYVFWTARGVSKHGGLGQDDVTLELGRVLTRDEALWLYQQVRDQSRRPEFEWRGEFLALFPQVTAAELPPPLVSEAEERRQAELSREESLRVFGRPGPCVADEDIPF